MSQSKPKRPCRQIVLLHLCPNPALIYETAERCALWGQQRLTGRLCIMNGDAVWRWGVWRVCLRVVGPSGGAGRDQMETGGRVFTSGVLPAGIACGQAGTAEVTFPTHHLQAADP